MQQRGYTLIEALVGLTIFTIVATAFYSVYFQLDRLNRTSKAKIIATAIANEQIELVRNATYTDVGTVGGLPAGVFPVSQSVNRNSINFSVNLTIKSVDDPFDGTIFGNPVTDLSPADYKLTQVKVGCEICGQPVMLATHIAPKNLESTGNNGALVVQAINASGQPVPGATVQIVNHSLTPAVAITDVTDNSGRYVIVDAPPANESYEITVSKNGYSTERTYLPNDPANPNPINPHATVVSAKVTQVTLAIDLTSTVNLKTRTSDCGVIANQSGTVSGAKLIGRNPDILKWPNQPWQTDAGGNATLSSIEWDSYQFTIDSPQWDIIGTIPTSPILVPPGVSQDVSLILGPKSTNSLVVTVKDASSNLPLSDASVTLTTSQGAQTRLTGQGYRSQIDWSGGGGQTDFVDNSTKFFESTNIDYTTSPGQITVDFNPPQQNGQPPSHGELVSSTFDFGGPTNFSSLVWQPTSHPPANGTVRLQIATNNDNATWNFVGSNDTPNSYYTVANTTLTELHDGHRYLRYKVNLTGGQHQAPIISEIAVSYSSSCAPPGQVFFSNLPSGEATVDVSLAGYQPVSQTVTISGAMRLDITLNK